MRTICRLSFSRIVLSGILLSVTPYALAQAPIASCTDDSTANTTTCRIDAPIVTQTMTEYDGAFHPEIFLAFSNDSDENRFGVQLPDIRLQRGDLVTVDADGCVQTGGVGRTWKRYVNPQGANADRLYHGLVGVREAIKQDGTIIPEPVRIQDVRLQPFWIPTVQPLRLGYEDDNYSDNGYWGHDDGNPEQCNLDGSHGFGGNAFVTVTIQHNTPPPLEEGRNWDLVPNLEPGTPGVFDANGFFLNPRWRWQLAGSAIPEFNPEDSTQPIARDLRSGPPGIIHSLTCDGGAKGHFNWFDNLLDVTLEGLVFWRDHSSGDDDYNVQIVTPSVNPDAPTFNGEELRAGVTPGTRALPDRATVPLELRGLRAIKGEFDSDETIDQEVFDRIPFWKDFHTAVDASDELAGRLIDGHPAIMTGLMGLDDEHENSSEIHPVHLFAIQMDQTRNPADDAWAIFVRNWGNEGYCSERQHFLNRETIIVRLRRPSGLPLTARAVVLPSTKFAGQNLGNAPRQFEVRSQAGTDATVVFRLPLPKGCTDGLFGSDCGLIAGELHLAWVDAPTGMPQAPRVASESVTRTTQALESNHKEDDLESDEEKDTFHRI